jgi:hypothetical protein
MSAKRLWFIPAAVLFFVLAASVQAPQSSTAVSPVPAMECPIVSPPIEIRKDNLDNRRPSAVFNPNHDEFLVAWDTVHDLFTTDVWAARVSLKGQVISSFNLATKAGEHRYDPDIAYDPERDKYLIAYTRGAPSSGNKVNFVTTSWDGSSVQAERPVKKDTNEQDTLLWYSIQQEMTSW